MCKARFGSQGVLLDGMANAIKNFDPYLIWTIWCVMYFIWHLQLWPLFLPLVINRFDAVDLQLGQSPVCRRGLEFTESWSCSLNRETNFQLFSIVGMQVTQNFCAFHSHYWHRLWQSDYTRKIQLNKSILKGGPFPDYNAQTQVFRSFPSNHWMFKKSAECHVFWQLANYFSCCGMAAGAQTFRQIDDILVHSLPAVVFNNFYRISNSWSHYKAGSDLDRFSASLKALKSKWVEETRPGCKGGKQTFPSSFRLSYFPILINQHRHMYVQFKSERSIGCSNV